jgi:hypothetical protein
MEKKRSNISVYDNTLLLLTLYISPWKYKHHEREIECAWGITSASNTTYNERASNSLCSTGAAGNKDTCTCTGSDRDV